ncbi:hypothetical protein CDAR_234661 [Caerostris darwini]|uniref:Uncharacterized protein n=1 Tax=Caerostris darwini TaxID=1538125 RepID=A0AAV4TJF5_9ARAC|nr:hypothetical protein CDAR_234661 [Caerostris darwini]
MKKRFRYEYAIHSVQEDSVSNPLITPSVDLKLSPPVLVLLYPPIRITDIRNGDCNVCVFSHNEWNCGTITSKIHLRNLPFMTHRSAVHAGTGAPKTS